MSTLSLHIFRHGQNSCDPVITQITEPFDHSEGPIWDGRRNILYFVDIHKGGICAYHYSSELLTMIHLNGDVSPLTTSKNDPNLFFVGVNRSVIALEWDGFNHTPSNQEILTTVSQDFPLSRFNDGKADSKGRLWWGKL